MTTKKKLTVFADFYIKPDRIEEWKEIHRPVWDAVANEPKCLLFDMFEHPAEKGHFRLFQVRDASDQEWFEKNQLTRPYEQDMWPKSKPLWERDIEITYMVRLGEGFSCRKQYLGGIKCRD
jgi:quinol monooxygenase YgiN